MTMIIDHSKCVTDNEQWHQDTCRRFAFKGQRQKHDDNHSCPLDTGFRQAKYEYGCNRKHPTKQGKI
jgi:hypothetical protein